MIEKPYKEIDYVWVSSHYDFHREGLCRHEGKLARFTCIEDYPDDYGTCGEDCDGCPKCDNPPIVCNIWPLSPLERVNWLRRKKAFELMVGYHWTYPYRRQGTSFHYRRPKWLSRMMFKIYYLPHRWRLKRAASR